MIRINLIPTAQRPPKWTTGRTIGVMALAFAVFLGAWYGYYAVAAWNMENKIAEAKAKYDSLKPVRDKMLEANQKEQMIRVKTNRIAGLSADRKSWHATMAHVSTLTSAQVWLTDVDAPDKAGLKMKGMALSVPDLARFVQRLEQDKVFSDPLLVKTEKDGALPADRFELAVKMRGGAL